VRHTITAGLLALAATPSFAAGLERSNQSMNILFQQGRYVEFGASYVSPKISGNAAAATGNIGRKYFNGSFSYKADLNEKLSYAIILDQPYGADTLYPTGTGATFAGSSGVVKNTTLTGVMRYKFGNGFSAYAGLRSSWTSGQAFIAPFAGGYTLSTNTDQAFGYLLGVAYEKPEIALRVALTYNSQIKHKLTPTETTAGIPVAPANPDMNVKLPASVNLEFQSGVAKDTLVFGSIRWVKWKDFVLPAPALGAILVAYPKNSTTYTLGVGRKFNDTWSGSVSVAHDTGTGNPTSNLGPVGKRNSIALGLSYTKDAMTISGGIQYARLGSATTTTVAGQFGGNSAIGAGIRVGFRF